MGNTTYTLIKLRFQIFSVSRLDVFSKVSVIFHGQFLAQGRVDDLGLIFMPLADLRKLYYIAKVKFSGI